MAAMRADPNWVGHQFAHLDFWRIKRLGDQRWAFGPIELVVKWRERDEALVYYLSQTPRHGMLWADAEAMEFIGSTATKEVAKVTRRINTRFWEALRLRAGAGGDLFVAGPLLRNFRRVRNYSKKPREYDHGVAFQDGMAWVSAFRAAISGGITGAEVRRLNAMIHTKFKVRDLREAEPIKVTVSQNDDYLRWKGMSADQPLWQAIVRLAEHNNDEPLCWGDIHISYGWGWLTRRKGEVVCKVCGK